MTENTEVAKLPMPSPEEQVVILKRQLTISEGETEAERDRRRDLHLGWLEDMDRWAERETWLHSRIQELEDEKQTLIKQLAGEEDDSPATDV